MEGSTNTIKQIFVVTESNRLYKESFAGELTVVAFD